MAINYTSACVSLLIPYLLWIIILIAAYFVIVKVGMSDGGNSVYDYSAVDFLMAFFNENVSDDGAIALLTGSGAPIAFHMWFIRDLMITCLLSPAIYAMCRSKVVGGVVSIVPLVLWVCCMDLDASGHYYPSLLLRSLPQGHICNCIRSS